MCKTECIKFIHPFLFTDGKSVFRKDLSTDKSRPVRISRHHLYPRAGENIKGVDKEKFILRMWHFKHCSGWNKLFQYNYTHKNSKKTSKLNIEEVLTLMQCWHPFILGKIGTPEWKIVFKERNLQEAFELLCRFLSMKFHIRWKHRFPTRIKLLISKAA